MHLGCSLARVLSSDSNGLRPRGTLGLPQYRVRCFEINYRTILDNNEQPNHEPTKRSLPVELMAGRILRGDTFPLPFVSAKTLRSLRIGVLHLVMLLNMQDRGPQYPLFEPRCNAVCLQQQQDRYQQRSA
jgi:hypothetical protein